MSAPVLILQMQRLGDLILTFPLVLDLLKKMPSHPIFIVAEEIFFRSLIKVAPPVTFFPPSFLAEAKRQNYILAFNLSSRPEAAACMASLKAEAKFGPLLTQDSLHIEGFWHLYRHSLTQNNRHNTFHWSDLYRMDLCDDLTQIETKFTLPKFCGSKRVGLVLGASTPFKHPNSAFWITLARFLIEAGLHPFLIGGKSEAQLGQVVAKGLNLPNANLCGKLSIGELALVMKTFDLCITPDTGPMHLANWLGIPVLNLSMGPVRAFETGPYSPNQTVLCPNLSCAGCWQCQKPSYLCKAKFQPLSVAHKAIALLTKKPLPKDPHLQMAKTYRERGLANLKFEAQNSCEKLLDSLWRNLFLSLAQPSLRPQIKPHLENLKTSYPKVQAHILRQLSHLLPLALKNFQKKTTTPPTWLAKSQAIRLFTG
ncbi:MAG: glycosyltransferase family 9 protein, partial [Desulfovibrionaceae bacterium]|nr:glycosyltransferase family 9 protein [Desulfovibrionaceae bacterium]